MDTTLQRTAFLSKLKRQGPSLVLTILLLASASLNVLLARKVGRLRYSIREIEAEARLKVGAVLPPLPAESMDGEPVTLSFGGGSSPTILHVISPTCGWCTRNIPNMRGLAEQVKGRYRVVTISLSDAGLRDYIAQNDLAAPVYGRLSDDDELIYRLHGTPQTIVLSPEGKVLKHWKGAYSEETRREVEGFFGISLPGLAPPK